MNTIWIVSNEDDSVGVQNDNDDIDDNDDGSNRLQKFVVVDACTSPDYDNDSIKSSPNERLWSGKL